ncbi:MAG: hypothetical protein JWN34_4313 [Bryobacterales bacterium]|nr:hypothetical protein [Bryobacterales bacterium]
MAATWQIDDRRFANIALYETRIHRMIARNRKELRQLQDERKAAEAEALAEAELLTRLALLKGEKLSPEGVVEVNHAKGNAGLVPRAGLLPNEIEANGFVFSNARILQIINRKELLLEAQHHGKSGWSPNRPYSTDRFRFPLAA